MSNELTQALQSLFVVALVAALAPVIVGLVPRLRVPQVVVLIVGGVIVGPQVLNLAEPQSIELLSNVGLGFLFLLAGYELELAPLPAAGRQARGHFLGGLGCVGRCTRGPACVYGLGTRVRPGRARADHDSAGHTAARYCATTTCCAGPSASLCWRVVPSVSFSPSWRSQFSSDRTAGSSDCCRCSDARRDRPPTQPDSAASEETDGCSRSWQTEACNGANHPAVDRRDALLLLLICQRVRP